MTDRHPLRTRELMILGPRWESVLGVDMKVLYRLFDLADPTLLYGLHRSVDPSQSWDLYVGEDSVSLWLDRTRLSEVAR